MMLSFSVFCGPRTFDSLMQLHIYFELHDIDHSVLFYLGVDGEKSVSYLMGFYRPSV